MKFGEKLKMILEYKNIKQKELAAMLHISPSTVNGYANDHIEPDIELIKKIASILGVTTDYLLDFGPNSTPALSVKEITLINSLRSLDKDSRELVYALTKILSAKKS